MWKLMCLLLLMRGISRDLNWMLGLRFGLSGLLALSSVWVLTVTGAVVRSALFTVFACLVWVGRERGEVEY